MNEQTKESPSPGCNCLDEMEQTLKVKLLEDGNHKPWRDAQLDTVICAGKVLSLAAGKWILTIPFQADWKRTTKAGGTQRANRTVNVAADYCPLCGKKAVE